MRLLLVADGRSPHSHSWITGAAGLVDSMLVLSSADVPPPAGLPGNVDWVRPGVLPRLRTRMATGMQGVAGDVLAAPSTRESAVILLRHGFEFAIAANLAAQLRRLGPKYQPDLIHCLRLPWEGIAGCAFGRPLRPTVISLWGSDLLTQSGTTPLLASLSRRALSKCSGVVADCHRDIELAGSWGLPAGAPTVVVDGNMGLDPSDFPARVNFDPGPQAHFLCTRATGSNLNWAGILHGLADVVAAGHPARLTLLNADAKKVLPLVYELGLADRVDLRGHVPREEFIELFSWADVLLSPTKSDGVPVSLLEGMLAGCFIVASDLASLRDLIDGPELGILLDPESQEAISAAMLHAAQPAVRSAAAKAGTKRIHRDYSRAASQERVRQFYDQVAR
ncbi:MAG: glycosyltransferase family 4 protein [Candidatus Nanopelagicales bacterium]